MDNGPLFTIRHYCHHYYGLMDGAVDTWIMDHSVQIRYGPC